MAALPHAPLFAFLGLATACMAGCVFMLPAPFDSNETPADQTPEASSGSLRQEPAYLDWELQEDTGAVRCYQLWLGSDRPVRNWRLELHHAGTATTTDGGRFTRRPYGLEVLPEEESAELLPEQDSELLYCGADVGPPTQMGLSYQAW